MRGNLANSEGRDKRRGLSRRRKSARTLPPLILMTDSRRLPDPMAVVDRLAPGSAILLRHYDAPDRVHLARNLARACRRRGIRLLIAGDWRLAVAAGADGIHLPEGLARRGPPAWAAGVRRRPGFLVTAAAHSPRAIRRALDAGADAVLLSPVFPTASHPGAPCLGALLFARWCRESPLPVYALGGVDSRTAGRLAGSGLAGIAGIGGIAGVEGTRRG